MTLTVKEHTENVFHVEAESQYEIASTFMRVQEYYESPYRDIWGKYFTHEYYMDRCAHNKDRSTQDDIKFTYLEDWAGFNVPGDVFNKWVAVFSSHGPLWDKEQKLIDLIREHVSHKTSNYYVIGTYDATTIDHELSHAWWYLDPDYQKDQKKNVKSLTIAQRNQLSRYIIGQGYRESVIPDEIAAYLSTNTMVDTNDMFEKIKVPWNKILNFQETFWEYKDTKLEEDEDN